MLQLAIVLLPLAMGAVGVGAQEARPSPQQGRDPGNAAQAAQRQSGQREPLDRWRHDPSVPMRVAAPPPSMRSERPPRQAAHDSRSMSDAVRRVQRSTQGQILGAQQVPFEGRNITRVKYMDSSGRVRYMDDPGVAERRPAPRRADNDVP